MFKQAEFIPGLIKQLREEPNKVTEDFETIRNACMSTVPLLPTAAPRQTDPGFQ